MNEYVDMINLPNLTQYLSVVKGLKPKTILRYVTCAKFIIARGIHSQEQYENLIAELKKTNSSPSLINGYVTTLSHHIDYLDHHRIPHRLNKLKALRVITQPVREILTNGEIKRLIGVNLFYHKTPLVNEEINQRYKTQILFLALTGCRVSEMCSLESKDVDLQRKECWFYHTKNGTPRKADLPDILCEAMKPFVKEGLVFKTIRGGATNQSMLNDDLHRRARKVGIAKRVHCHLFRHSFATELLEHDVELATVATALGHRNVNVTFAQYSHISSTKVREAIRRHGLVSETLEPTLVLKHGLEVIKKLPLMVDERIETKLTETSNGFELAVVVK